MDELPLDLEALRSAIAAGRSFHYHFFYGHRREPDGVFSQWWPCAFEVDGERYATAERDILTATGDAILVEASPRDRIWGIGLAASSPLARDPATWRGRNLLGFALVATRRMLASSDRPAS